MSGLNPEFKLAELDFPEKKMARIDRVRKETLPKPKRLEKYRERAERNGIVEIDENELAIGPEEGSGVFRLEHGPTTHKIGSVGHNLFFRQREYRLLWLIDGRTIEIIRFKPTESYIIYADGIEIGSIDESKSERFFFFFRLPSAWTMRIGETEVCRMDVIKHSSVQIRFNSSDNESTDAWIGTAKRQSMDAEVLRLLHWARLRKAAPANTMWLLPRDKQHEPLADTLKERIGLMALALLLRNAYHSTDS